MMSEIEVVVDVRQSPDSLDLIVVKQKFATTGELHATGVPVESKLGMGSAKANITLSCSEYSEMGLSLVATVTSISLASFWIDRVAFVWTSPEGTNEQQPFLGSGHPLTLYPGKSEDYLLPQLAVEDVAMRCLILSPDQYWIAAYAGKLEVARAAGDEVLRGSRTFLEKAGITIHQRTQSIFDTLSDADQLAAIRSVADLRRIDPNLWPSKALQKLPGSDDLYLVRAEAGLRVLVRPVGEKRFEILEIVRSNGEPHSSAKSGQEEMARHDRASAN